MVGHQIGRILVSEYKLNNCIKNAILIDPGKTGTNELYSIGNNLKYNKCLVLRLFEKSATAFKVMNSLDYLPYDLCIISTHCGEVGGADQTFQFKASDGKCHSIRVWAVHTFAPHYDNNEMVTVQTLYIQKEADGVCRDDIEGWQKIKGWEIFEEFMKLDLMDTKVINRGEIRKVQFSQTLQLYGQNYMPSFHGFNSRLPPVFINNSCFSAYEMADNFMFAGARGYVRTVNSVQTWVAEEVINIFLKLDNSLPVTTRLWLTQKDIYSKNKYFQYVFYGLPFSRLKCGDYSMKAIIKNYYKKLNSIQSGYFKNIR
jgi:hypothetical protein